VEKLYAKCGTIQNFYIFIHCSEPSRMCLTGRMFTLQDGNHSKKMWHNETSEMSVYSRLEWSPGSPDLHIMELMWDYMTRQKQLKQCRSINEQWHVSQDAWSNPPVMYPEKLSASVPLRAGAVTKAKNVFAWCKSIPKIIHDITFQSICAQLLACKTVNYIKKWWIKNQKGQLRPPFSGRASYYSYVSLLQHS